MTKALAIITLSEEIELGPESVGGLSICETGLIASAARHSRRSIVLSSFYRGQLPELHRLSIGPDLVFGRLWAETGCRDVLRSLVADRRFSFDVERAVYLTVLHRLMISGFDRHCHDWGSL